MIKLKILIVSVFKTPMKIKLNIIIIIILKNNYNNHVYNWKIYALPKHLNNSIKINLKNHRISRENP